jgi:hypothetical protein
LHPKSLHRFVLEHAPGAVIFSHFPALSHA